MTQINKTKTPMTQAKPIAIIYFPENTDGGGGRGWIWDYMRYLNGEKPSDFAQISYGEQKNYWKDYYWFCFYKYGIDEPEIKVFYEKDFTEIQFAELKKLIDDSIEEMKQKSNPKPQSPNS